MNRLENRSDYFVTGTDTEIGKTLTSAALLYALSQRGLRVVGMKPVAAGASLIDGVWHNDDVDMLQAASSIKVSTDLVSPYLMQAAAAPHIVAMQENVSISDTHIQTCYTQLQQQSDAVIVEGVGGFCVPLTATFDTAQMAQQFALPVIMVVGMRLGCINHALLTAEAINARGLKLVAWVANTTQAKMSYFEENVEALKDRLPAPLLGIIPSLADPSAQAAASYLNLDLIAGLT
ncbi:dethiobiotin synthase [Undibacterium sp. RTI2.1]|uniref:dethiobiotin synthase n=1 Tax=unclassified Undibacterium TaxID=2630295 RepID=UPI002AB41135|nr:MULTISPECIES: dethiobiotin synthase [unclassified Undibacterium]MDY7539478.1 dethiobiotin synthase [Undibacterium sp. 5I1]MEB0029606.1 dethiobiotin synthase [Undibacterium sp. RTI2.1]MEB0116077.1 dethiobiotin synthase [Undibacterium sp. RTI2.2]MEB0230736.1 dethiobiotin synthase [Undibacterium sp. 10I3]MEB0258785.1 dethiobiotin synthase [Undibacterium sp. 5I1]